MENVTRLFNVLNVLLLLITSGGCCFGSGVKFYVCKSRNPRQSWKTFFDLQPPHIFLNMGKGMLTSLSTTADE